MGPPAAGLARLVRGYYLATPAFLLADLLFGVDVRTPFLDALPALKWGWYAVATLIGVAAWRWPRWTPHLGLTEAGLDIVVLVLSVGNAYLNAATSESGAAAFRAGSVVNLLMSGTMLVVSYLVAQAHLSTTTRRR